MNKDFNAAYNNFSVALLRSSAIEGKNTIISPLSVLTAMGMAQNGAGGETLAQLNRVLCAADSERLNTELQAYMERICSDELVRTDSANSIWLRRDGQLELTDDFVRTVEQYYAAQIFRADFDAACCDRINSWISENTDGMIPRMLDSISEETIMLIINAIVLDAKWASPYDESRITDGGFTAADGTRQKARYMKSVEHSYIEGDRCKGMKKYYLGGSLYFAALLPDEGLSADELVASLTGEELTALFKNSSDEYEVEASLPSFKADYNRSILDCLKTMGITDAFTDDADFSAMSHTCPLQISDVIHAAHIEVDKDGTKAAAATVCTLRVMSLLPRERRKLKFDRPFVYAVVDSASDTPLFIGVLNTLN